MRLIRTDGDDLVFQIGKREKRLLVDVLKLYPLIPAWHHRVSRSGEGNLAKSSQKLLDEALADQRRENKKQLQTLINDEARFKANELGYEFSLNTSQVEWLLQVLNDIRVGSWLILGEPDEKNGKNVELSPENSNYVLAMEICGYFEGILLRGFEQPGAA